MFMFKRYYLAKFLSEGYPFYIVDVYDLEGVPTGNFTSHQNGIAAKRFDNWIDAKRALDLYLEGKKNIKQKYIHTVEILP